MSAAATSVKIIPISATKHARRTVSPRRPAHVSSRQRQHRVKRLLYPWPRFRDGARAREPCLKARVMAADQSTSAPHFGFLRKLCKMAVNSAAYRTSPVAIAGFVGFRKERFLAGDSAGQIAVEDRPVPARVRRLVRVTLGLNSMNGSRGTSGPPGTSSSVSTLRERNGDIWRSRSRGHLCRRAAVRPRRITGPADVPAGVLTMRFMR
jgi:hypothetical protein